MNAKRPQLVMGSVQLGLPYGAANASGMPSEAVAIEMLRSARRDGIRWIDTARAYGDAERRIGLATEIGDHSIVVTKLDPLTQYHPESSQAEIERAVLASLEASRAALRRETLETVLLHRAAHMRAWNGIAWRVLKEQRGRGAIERIGVSVTTAKEAFAAIADEATDHIQLPFNLLDWRWRRLGVIDALRRRPELVVHVRSVFLQGLLGGDPGGRWPVIDGFDPAQCLADLKASAHRLGRVGTLDLCLAYVRGQDWIDGIVVGMETPAQLSENLRLFQRWPLDTNAIAWIDDQSYAMPAALVDIPSWSPTRQYAARSG